MSLVPTPELEKLIHLYLDGQITPDAMERLNHRLRHNELDRQLFVEHLTLDSALADVASGLVGQQAAVDDIIELNQRAVISGSLITSSLLAAAATILLIVSWWWTGSYQSYATVVRSVGVPSLVDGMAVRSELNVFREGVVEFITVRGARVVIEAPAEFRFESPQRLDMRQGRLTADVPPSAVGFTVVTPTGDVIDLGTRFAVDISSQTQSEVHVFEGVVSARSKGSDQRQHLTASSAVRLGSNAAVQPCDVRQGAFVGNREMDSMADALLAGQQLRAARASTQLKSDPALLAWLDFEPTDNLSSTHVAQIVGAQTAQGKFPGTGAIDFIEEGDCVLLNLNVRTPQFTLMTWARFNQIQGRKNSLYSTDEWGELGQIHWLIGDQSNPRFAIKGATPAESGNTNVWLESQPRSLTDLERWVHLAIVYDAHLGRATQYLNGEAIAVADMPLGLEAALGPAQLGNWKPQSGKEQEPRRRLSGRMDEFAAFARALSASEIRDYYVASTPYR